MLRYSLPQMQRSITLYFHFIIHRLPEENNGGIIDLYILFRRFYMNVNNVNSNDEYKKQIRYLKRYNTLSLIVTLCFGILLFLFLVYLFTNQFSSFWAYYVLGILAALCAIIMNFLLSLKPFLALTTPLNDECDPHKFIALNQAINRRPHPLPLVYSLGYFFLGHFYFAPNLLYFCNRY